MNSTNTIFLNDSDQVVNLFGKEFTAEELRNAVIDSTYYRKELDRVIKSWESD